MQLIRSSLKKVNERINEFDFILRCHRTFIVNINYIKEIIGNSRGYKIRLENLDFPVFVSQKYLSEFKDKIK